MKKLNLNFLALIVLLLGSISSYAQSYFEYTYDASGNRTQRKVIVVPAAHQPSPPPAARAVTPQDTVATTNPAFKTDTATTPQTILFPADVFPNPTYGLVNVMIQGQGNYTGILINAEGKIVMQTIFYNEQNVIDLGVYGDGIFILRITATDGKAQEFKIIKKS